MAADSVIKLTSGRKCGPEVEPQNVGGGGNDCDDDRILLSKANRFVRHREVFASEESDKVKETVEKTKDRLLRVEIEKEDE
jgi:hypothetical protein